MVEFVLLIALALFVCGILAAACGSSECAYIDENGDISEWDGKRWTVFNSTGMHVYEWNPETGEVVEVEE